MTESLKSINGMNDILPDQTPIWQYFESTVAKLLNSYGYKQIRTPIMEFTGLFKRSIGEVTDIVEKEMYTLEKEDGKTYTLRPENTAAVVRSMIEHGLTNAGRVQKLWYVGPMFRRERPQKGRYRQFHQIGVEVFNLAGPDIDAELIALTWRLWKILGIEQELTLELNSLGSLEARNAYKQALVEYLTQYQDQLDEDSKRRLTTNPLRILDTKIETTKAILKNAPVFTDYMDADSLAHFKGLTSRLEALNIPYVINTNLVRGLDYYNKTVFEWTTNALGAQGTVCGGGRYDGLFEQIGGKATTGVGFAMGVERLILLLEALNKIPPQLDPLDCYFVAVGEGTDIAALKLAEHLRTQLPHLSLQVNAGGGNFKNQLKKADNSGASYALILGENELINHSITLKSLRNEAAQETITWDDLANYLATILN